MQHSTNFQVYNASAGSGKTFTLVKEYLKIVLSSTNPYKFQQILAVTFTNKAAGEMKERVIENLDGFSKEEKSDMLAILCEELKLDEEAIFNRAKIVLSSILQNYSAFNITTIDSFTYKLIRTFAYDLNLPVNADVELDAQSLLNEAVDVVISKIGENKELTKLLVNYAVQKLENDKAWDISNDLKSFAKIILNESNTKQLEQFKNISISELETLKFDLQKKNKLIETEFIKLGEKGLKLIEDNGLQHNQFSYSDLPKFLIKLTKIKLVKVDDIKFEGRLNKSIEAEKNFYTAKCDASTKGIIESITNDLRQLYYDSKELYEQKFGQYVFNGLVIDGLLPLAVLSYINNSLQEIKTENNILLNAEFNKIISDTIKNEPAPFIYERIGEKFRYYFIDEMQDTSELQWQNLIPLISNAISGENELGESGKLMLVGDAKQSIYRWRGGKAEQFISLSSEENNKENNPFFIHKSLQNLEFNYRSCSEVIEFNNGFFTHLSKFLGNASYSNLYNQGNAQKLNKNKGGFVQISFVEKEKDDDERDLVYAKKVYSIIENLDTGFEKNDVCVLVRTRKQGVEVANYLSSNGVEIISSETLLLRNNSIVNFLINTIEVIQNPQNKELKIKLLYFLFEYLNIEESKHIFFDKLVHLENEEFFKALEHYNIIFNNALFIQQPLYAAVEYLIRSFNLLEKADAYIQFFLDVVFEFQQKKQASILNFLEYWEQKKDSLSIVAPESKSAVRIMTIHKAKGLEFPVVIFPYNMEIYRQIDPKVWFPLEDESKLKSVLVNYNKKLNFTGKVGEALFNKRREELELDNFNLLYVALTRAVEQLYVVTEKMKSQDSLNYTSNLFVDYLNKIGVYNDDELEYSFGNPQKIIPSKKEEGNAIVPESIISNSWDSVNISVVASSSVLWETDQGDAIDYGNLIHEMLSKINVEENIKGVINKYLFEGTINKKEFVEIERVLINVVSHPKLSVYFQDNNTVYAEKSIFTDKNEIVVPDRVVVIKNKTTVIDYKTGKPESKHEQQVNYYAQVLKNMGFVIDKKILIYINNEIIIKEL
ncbi:ATP-dependent exoDNAse (exonuclease V) beta subunit (contains helicase and exonuclease domains) [Lutibacter oricola]|uniref:DNA 3'-5' helicase n=1 Tax=Lutibacter oricola TaxID=762486 RepID=A0A1H3DBB9_9FLAO|nr:UvrD-helicase domain-containing protein [Lutibacter oricola]SDX63438.1 ATP-dependent exoDNAse (exonuclease V) beta subunit (contains helicase and exonuclease domains) [Lutibacter oricola]